MLGPKNMWKKFWAKKIFEKKFGSKKYLRKILGPKNIWKIFGKILIQKNFGSEKNFGSKKILVQKKVLSERNKVPKKCWVKFCVQNNCGSKEYESEKNFESKFFGPSPSSYGIGLSMVGWIGGSIPLL